MKLTFDSSGFVTSIEGSYSEVDACMRKAMPCLKFRHDQEKPSDSPRPAYENQAAVGSGMTLAEISGKV